MGSEMCIRDRSYPAGTVFFISELAASDEKVGLSLLAANAESGRQATIITSASAAHTARRMINFLFIAQVSFDNLVLLSATTADSESG